MKTILFALMLLASIKSNGQNTKWGIDPSKKNYPAVYFEILMRTAVERQNEYCVCGILPKTHSHRSELKSVPLKISLPDNSKIDTVPTILLCADTSNITSVRLTDKYGNVRFDGLTTPVSLGTQMTTFTVIGYRVAGDILYQVTSRRQLIDGLTYLDAKKRPLPESFIVLSFVDRKQ